MATIALQIEQMHCGACVRRVTQTINSLPGTHADKVEIGSARVTTEVSPDQITTALATAGFPAHVASTHP